MDLVSMSSLNEMVSRLGIVWGPILCWMHDRGTWPSLSDIVFEHARQGPVPAAPLCTGASHALWVVGDVHLPPGALPPGRLAPQSPLDELLERFREHVSAGTWEETSEAEDVVSRIRADRTRRPAAVSPEAISAPPPEHDGRDDGAARTSGLGLDATLPHERTFRVNGHHGEMSAAAPRGPPSDDMRNRPSTADVHTLSFMDATPTEVEINRAFLDAVEMMFGPHSTTSSEEVISVFANPDMPGGVPCASPLPPDAVERVWRGGAVPLDPAHLPTSRIAPVSPLEPLLEHLRDHASAGPSAAPSDATSDAADRPSDIEVPGPGWALLATRGHASSGSPPPVPPPDLPYHEEEQTEHKSGDARPFPVY
jgi:hypothetical protein